MLNRVKIVKRQVVKLAEDTQRHLANLERIKNFCLMDDLFMTKCFEDDIPCVELVLRIILDKDDLQVTESHTQDFLANLINRSVRLDVLATDSTGKKYNIEIQRADKGAGEKRARYNSSLLDSKIMQKGADFDDLPETYIIFITENDVMKHNLPLYRIERYNMDTNEIFNDGAHIIYVNGAYRDDTPLGWLMHDFSCQKADDMKYKILADKVKLLKEDQKGVAKMSRIVEEMLKEEKQEAARRMLTAGKLPLEDIAEYSGLSLDEVKQLQKEKSA